MSAIASMLNDDERMMCGITGDEDAFLKQLQDVGLPMDALELLLASSLLDIDASYRLREYFDSLAEYHSVRLRISPRRATTYPFARLPDDGNGPANDKQWNQDGNLFHYSTVLGGERKCDQALYIWLCLAQQST